VASLDLSLILHDGVFELIDGDGTQGFLEVHPKGILNGNDDVILRLDIILYDTEYDCLS
jgi:hypothetical protein